MRKINLNLLFHLYALLKEKKVSEAAKQAYITQPAMSASLKQLRFIFDDPILVKDGRSLELSSKGKELLPQIEEIINNIDRMIDQQADFKPEFLDKTFNLSIPNYLQILIIPKLKERLNRYPSIKLNTINFNTVDNPAMFKEHNLDLAIGAFAKESVSEQLAIEKLFEQAIVCYGSKDNEHLQNSISLNQYLSLDHVAVSFNEDLYNPSANALKEKSMNRKDIIYVESFLTAIYIIASSTKLISTGPQFLLDMFKDKFHLTYQPLPFDVTATPIYVATHKASTSNKETQWLKSMILDIINKDVIGKYPSLS